MAQFETSERQETYNFWVSVADALRNIVTEIRKGTNPKNKKLNDSFIALKPPRLEHFECSFCDKVIADYNGRHGTNLKVTNREMCYEANCPAIPMCKENPYKWEAFQCLSCILYFHEGVLFYNEGNRFPLCREHCTGFVACEEIAPTDTKNFTDLSEETKMTKLKFCSQWFLDEVFEKKLGGNEIFRKIIEQE